jgi:hypothetical protein
MNLRNVRAIASAPAEPAGIQIAPLSCAGDMTGLFIVFHKCYCR